MSLSFLPIFLFLSKTTHLNSNVFLLGCLFSFRLILSDEMRIRISRWLPGCLCCCVCRPAPRADSKTKRKTCGAWVSRKAAEVHLRVMCTTEMSPSPGAHSAPVSSAGSPRSVSFRGEEFFRTEILLLALVPTNDSTETCETHNSFDLWGLPLFVALQPQKATGYQTEISWTLFCFCDTIRSSCTKMFLNLASIQLRS